jgi:citrate lyase subunit beta/citryl-CoA lyase
MSERSKSLPRRACLSTPGSSERFLAKAPSVAVDFTFFDLEDSVAPSEKVRARANVIAALHDDAWDERILCVRVNQWGSAWVLDDVRDIVSQSGTRLDEVMMPKVEDASQVVAMDALLSEVERSAGLPAGHVGLEVQIESARGLLNVESICAASSRIESIVFGPADFAASIGMPITTIDEHIHDGPSTPFSYAYAKLLVAGRAFGLNVIDGPFLKVRDLEALRFAADVTASYGFDGKWALTPDQVPVINDVFTPSSEVFKKSSALLAAYRVATEQNGTGAVMFGEEMIDEASAKVAAGVVARGLRAGLSADAS